MKEKGTFLVFFNLFTDLFKDQLISKRHFGVFKPTEKPMKFM